MVQKTVKKTISDNQRASLAIDHLPLPFHRNFVIVLGQRHNDSSYDSGDYSVV